MVEEQRQLRDADAERRRAEAAAAADALAASDAEISQLRDRNAELERRLREAKELLGDSSRAFDVAEAAAAAAAAAARDRLADTEGALAAQQLAARALEASALRRDAELPVLLRLASAEIRAAEREADSQRAAAERLRAAHADKLAASGASWELALRGKDEELARAKSERERTVAVLRGRLEWQAAAAEEANIKLRVYRDALDLAQELRGQAADGGLDAAGGLDALECSEPGPAC